MRKIELTKKQELILVIAVGLFITVISNIFSSRNPKHFLERYLLSPASLIPSKLSITVEKEEMNEKN